MLRRQSLHGHAEVMADLAGTTESPSSCHFKLDDRWQMSRLVLWWWSDLPASCDLGKGCTYRQINAPRCPTVEPAALEWLLYLYAEDAGCVTFLSILPKGRGYSTQRNYTHSYVVVLLLTQTFHAGLRWFAPVVIVISNRAVLLSLLT